MIESLPTHIHVKNYFLIESLRTQPVAIPVESSGSPSPTSSLSTPSTLITGRLTCTGVGGWGEWLGGVWVSKWLGGWMNVCERVKERKRISSTDEQKSVLLNTHVAFTKFSFMSILTYLPLLLETGHVYFKIHYKYYILLSKRSVISFFRKEVVFSCSDNIVT